MLMTTETKHADLSSLRIDRASLDTAPGDGKGPWLKILIGIIIVAAVVGGYYYITGLAQAGIEVQLATVAYSSPSQANAVLTASGYVVAQRKAAVASKGTGRLVFLGVEEGDRVKEGQIIARLEDDDVVASQQQARANRTVAEAEVKDAQQWHARQKQMLDRNLTSQAEYDAAETRLNRVNASVVAARAALTAATVAVENTRIRAPFDGTVLLKHADVGEIVAPFASASSSRGAVVTIADMTSLEVEADVSESNIFRITPNLPCEISLDAYPDQRYQGYVSKIVPTADRAKATVLVKVKFKSYDYRVLPEMSAKITFLSKEADASAVNAKSVLSVPSNAVATRDGREVVYKVADGSAKEVPIVTGKKLGSMVEVQEGLSSGDRVIARVDERINDGVKVVVK